MEHYKYDSIVLDDRLQVTGPVEHHQADGLYEAAQDASADWTQDIVVDLTGCDFLPGAALTSLVRARNEAHRHGHLITLQADLRTHSRRVIDLTNLGGPDHLPIAS